ncbi:hypothetical protein SP21_69 [Salmonella phage 21]|nr:hypothetical protein SP21_69 [Salmonella phage 21]
MSSRNAGMCLKLINSGQYKNLPRGTSPIVCLCAYLSEDDAINANDIDIK